MEQLMITVGGRESEQLMIKWWQWAVVGVNRGSYND